MPKGKAAGTWLTEMNSNSEFSLQSFSMSFVSLWLPDGGRVVRVKICVPKRALNVCFVQWIGMCMGTLLAADQEQIHF